MAKIVDATAAPWEIANRRDSSPSPQRPVSPRGDDDRRKEQRTSVEQVQKAAAQAQEMSQAFGRSLRFEVKEAAGLVQVSVLDTVSDKVIRKIPPDNIVSFIEHVREMFGALLDTEA